LSAALNSGDKEREERRRERGEGRIQIISDDVNSLKRNKVYTLPKKYSTENFFNISTEYMCDTIISQTSPNYI
jgi:hypothetical protein